MVIKLRSVWEGHLARVSVSNHYIDISNYEVRPVHSAPNQSGLSARNFAEVELNRMMAAKVITPATTEWAARIVFAPNKIGVLHFCVDYHKLNAVAIHNSKPLRRMDECVDSLKKETVISTLDGSLVYRQLKNGERNRDKTAFTSHNGLHRFISMHFWLTDVAASFQRAMDVIFVSVQWKFFLFYLDDIMLFSKSPANHS